MPKLSVHFNDYVSLAVMLLMVVALVAGQVDAKASVADKVMSIAPITSVRDHLDDRISIAVASDLSHFRGEDE